MYKWKCNFGKLELLSKDALSSELEAQINSMVLLHEKSMNLSDTSSSLYQFNKYHKTLTNGYFEALMGTAYEYHVYHSEGFDPTLYPIMQHYAGKSRPSYADQDTSAIRDLIRMNNFYSFTIWGNPVKTADGRDSSYQTIEAEDVKYKLGFTFFEQAFLLYQIQLLLDTAGFTEYELHAPHAHFIRIPDLEEKAAEYFLPFRKFSVDPKIYISGRKAMAYVKIPTPYKKKESCFIPISKKNYKPVEESFGITFVEGEDILSSMVIGIAVQSMRTAEKRQNYLNQFKNIIYYHK